jgi:hypothetical protein
VRRQRLVHPLTDHSLCGGSEPGNWQSPAAPEASKNLTEVAGFDPGCVKSFRTTKALTGHRQA